MTVSKNSEKKIFLIINCLIALVGAYVIFYGTNWGVWGYSDSSTYLGAARSLAEGKGFVIQKSSGGIYLYRLFPPFYPMVLCVGSIITSDIFLTARVFNMILFGIFLFTVGYLLFLGTGNPVISIMGAAAHLVSPMMIENFTGAMTEPLFFCLIEMFMIIEYRYIINPSKLNEIQLILFLSLLPLTRYVGIVFIFTNFIILMIYQPFHFKNQLSSSLKISGISSLPILGWLGYIYLNSNQIAGRKVQIPHDAVNTFFEGMKIIPELFKDFLPYSGLHENILPSSVRLILFFIILLLLVGAAISLNKRTNSLKKESLSNQVILYIIMIHAFSFLVFIPLSYSLTERSYVIDHRILSPLIPMVIIIALLSYSMVIPQMKRFKKIAVAAAIIVGVFIFRFFSFQARTYIINLHENGRGYTAREYIQSGIINEIRKIPSHTIMISNSAGFVLFHDNRLAQQVDQFHARMYGTGNTASERIFRTGKAALIILFPDFYNYYGDQAKELLPLMTNGLILAYQDSVGAIYYYPVPKASVIPQ